MVDKQDRLPAINDWYLHTIFLF